MYKNKIIDGKIAYFKYSESSGQASFQEGFDTLLETVQRPEIDCVMSHVTDPKKHWSSKGQKAWLDTGVHFEKSNIKKWGVVCKEERKKLVLRYLINGGKDNRNYETFVTDNEHDCLKWLNQK